MAMVIWDGRDGSFWYDDFKVRVGDDTTFASDMIFPASFTEAVAHKVFLGFFLSIRAHATK